MSLLVRRMGSRDLVKGVVKYHGLGEVRPRHPLGDLGYEKWKVGGNMGLKYRRWTDKARWG